MSRRFARNCGRIACPPSLRGAARQAIQLCTLQMDCSRGACHRARVRATRRPRNDGVATRTTHMASIHKDIPIDAHPDDVWAAVRDFGAVHQRLAPGFVTDARLEGDARIVTFHNGNVAREILVDCDDDAAAAGLCNQRRAGETLQRLGAGGRRRRGVHPDDLDRRRTAQRNRALHLRPDGSIDPRDAENAGAPRRVAHSNVSFSGANRRRRLAIAAILPLARHLALRSCSRLDPSPVRWLRASGRASHFTRNSWLTP